MKWKRSKKAQQEAKAKAAAERAAKQNGTALPVKSPENKSKRITEEDEALSSEAEDEDIDVGGEGEDSDPMMSPLGPGPPTGPPGLVAPTPILGLPQPPALQLRPLLHPQSASLIRPPHTSDPNNSNFPPMETNLSALLPAHLARLSQAGNRLHRPFVA